MGIINSVGCLYCVSFTAPCTLGCWSQFGCPGTAAPWYQSSEARTTDAVLLDASFKKEASRTSVCWIITCSPRVHHHLPQHFLNSAELQPNSGLSPFYWCWITSPENSTKKSLFQITARRRNQSCFWLLHFCFKHIQTTDPIDFQLRLKWKWL